MTIQHKEVYADLTAEYIQKKERKMKSIELYMANSLTIMKYILKLFLMIFQYHHVTSIDSIHKVKICNLTPGT